MSKDVFDKVVEENEKTGKRFIGIYSSNATSLNGDDIVSAIKYFYSRYNAILHMVIDFKTNKIYNGKENDKPDVRGYYNYSYYDYDTKELVYNRDEATRPIDKLKPDKITKESEHGYIDRKGNFYETGFEGHRWLADELFITKTVELNKKDKYKQKEIILDDLGWVKISSKRIHYKSDFNNPIKLTKAQKKTIIKYMDIIGDENYEFQYYMNSKYEIENKLNNENY